MSHPYTDAQRRRYWFVNEAPRRDPSHDRDFEIEPPGPGWWEYRLARADYADDGVDWPYGESPRMKIAAAMSAWQLSVNTRELAAQVREAMPRFFDLDVVERAFDPTLKPNQCRVLANDGKWYLLEYSNDGRAYTWQEQTPPSRFERRPDQTASRCRARFTDGLKFLIRGPKP